MQVFVVVCVSAFTSVHKGLYQSVQVIVLVVAEGILVAVYVCFSSSVCGILILHESLCSRG